MTDFPALEAYRAWRNTHYSATDQEAEGLALADAALAEQQEYIKKLEYTRDQLLRIIADLGGEQHGL